MSSALDIKALNVFLKSPVTQEMMKQVVTKTLQVLPCLDTKSEEASSKSLPSLMSFLNSLVQYTNVYTGTLMASIVYLERLRAKLPKNAQGIASTRHRILLSCIILSAKYHNDSSPKNIHWSRYTKGLFSLEDINLMERQLMYLLNWDLRVSTEEMIAALGGLLDNIKQDLINSSTVCRHLKQRQQMRQKKLYNQKVQATVQHIAPLHYTSSNTLNIATPKYRETHLNPYPSGCAGSNCTSPPSPRSSVSRSSSRSSLGLTRSHTSSSSISTVSSNESRLASGKIDPHIEFAARVEELELNRMLQQHRPRLI